MEFGMLAMWDQMGFVARATVVVLALMSIWTVKVTVDRFLLYRSAKKQSIDFLPLATQCLKGNKLPECVELAKKYRKSHLARVVSAGLQEMQSESKEGIEGGLMLDAVRRSMDRESILVPDHEFYFSRGFARYRAAADAGRKSWNARTGTIVWRGSTTGRGRKADDEMTADDAELSLRTRVCLTLRGVPGTDVRFARIVQSRAPEADKLRLQRAGVFGEVIEPTAWLSHRFALDIDGNSNTWSNFFTRLLAGCCVIKVASPLGYRQWYYDALKPWEHFVPVEADLSDLLEKIDWCRANDRACAEIAAAGRAFAMRRDFDTEMALAVDTLNARLTP